MAEATTINFNISERVAALKLFDAFKGSISTLSTIIDDVKQFPVVEKEWEDAHLVKTPGAEEGSEQWKWDNDVVMKDITLQEATLAYLKQEIQKKSDAGEITFADVALISLQKKL